MIIIDDIKCTYKKDVFGEKLSIKSPNRFSYLKRTPHGSLKSKNMTEYSYDHYSECERILYIEDNCLFYEFRFDISIEKTKKKRNL
jgi:hypothetical protein